MRLPGSAGLGAATGLRSMAAPSQLSRYLCESPGRAAKGRAAGVMAWPAARSVLQFAALGEMVVDKLPIVPDRIEAGPLLGRVVWGAVAGGVLAQLNRESCIQGALLGGAAAAAATATYAGYYVRKALTQDEGLPDLPVALSEDVIAIALARHACQGAGT